MRSLQATHEEILSQDAVRHPRAIWTYVVVWLLLSATLSLTLLGLNRVFVDREITRESEGVERSAAYAAALIENEIRRLEENARAVADHRGFAVRTSLYLGGDESIGPFLQERVESEVRARGYVCVQLLSLEGEELFVSFGDDVCPGVDVELLTVAAQGREVRQSDMSLGEGVPPVLRWMVPLIPEADAAPVAMVSLNSDPSTVIAEALEVPGAWRTLEVELTDEVGADQVNDDRVTGVSAVGGTPWFVTASVERDEVLEATSVITMMGALAVLAVSVAFALGLVLLRRVAVQRDLEHHTNDVLAQRVRAEERFVANMSHELRTPLNAIIGFARILESGNAGPVNEEQRKQLAMVSSAGKRLLALVNDLLDLSKARAGMTVPGITSFTAAELVNEVSDITCPLSTEKGLQCSLELPDHEIVLHSDRRLLERVLLNLASNAVKFTPAGGRVTLLVREQGKTVEFAVTDTGYGIEPDEMGRVMEEFFQGSSVPQSERVAGTGLGLPIALRLARLLGGDIVFSSEVGKGSTFVLRVPKRIPDGSASGELEMEL